MRLALAIQGHTRFAGLPARATLRRWVTSALEGDAEIVLRFVDAREGRRLNRKFRRRHYPANVLTFDYLGERRVVADIVLCVPVLRREAREQGKNFRFHLAHLVVHGVLHAQGHDHAKPRDARRMQIREARVLGALGVANPYA